MRLPLITRSLLCRFLGHSDVRRWSHGEEFLPEWEDRTRRLARLVPPGSHVLEFGAGRRTLEKYLPPGCRYVPSDLVSRGPDTFVCDLNRRPLPDLAGLAVDTAVFGGVLEYVRDLPELVNWLSAYIDRCVASYECAQPQSTAWQRLRQDVLRSRAGWVNTFQEEELVSLFQTRGLRLVHRDVWHTHDGDEPVFVFQKAMGVWLPPQSTPS